MSEPLLSVTTLSVPVYVNLFKEIGSLILPSLSLSSSSVSSSSVSSSSVPSLSLSSSSLYSYVNSLSEPLLFVPSLSVYPLLTVPSLSVYPLLSVPTYIKSFLEIGSLILFSFSSSSK